MKTTLATTYHKASTSQRDQLILDNIDYVARILSTMTVGISDAELRDTLHSAGILGLVEAANQFDPNRGVKFRTFAYRRIRGAIVDELRALAPVSQEALHDIAEVRKVYESCEPPLTPERIAKETGFSIDRVLQTLEAMRFVMPDDWQDLSDQVHGSWNRSTARPDDEVELQEQVEMLADCLDDLPDRERLVLMLYYKDELNLAEIGAVIGVSESRVSRLLAGGRFRLQEMIRCKTT